MRIFFSILLTFIANSLIGQCSSPNGSTLYPFHEILVHQDLAYGSNERQKLDIYLPEARANCKEVDLVLIIHGGSFEEGDKEGLASWAEYLATKGYHVAVMNYRLYMSADTDWGLLLNEPFLYFGEGQCEELNKMSFIDGIHKIDKAWYFAIQDSRAALAYLQHEFTIRHKNIRKLFVIGQSAGAITALGLTMGQQAEFDSLDSRLRAVYGDLNREVEYEDVNAKKIDGIICLSSGIINAEQFISSEDTIPWLEFHGVIDEAIPLCMDQCFYYDRRITGPLGISELAGLNNINLNLTAHYWADAGHELSGKYQNITDIALKWMHQENHSHSSKKFYPMDFQYNNCDLIGYNQQYDRIYELIAEEFSTITNKLYPNPNNGNFNVKIPGEVQSFVTIKVYDIFGHLVHVERTQLMSIKGINVHLRNLQRGMYLVKVSNSYSLLEQFKMIVE